MTAKDLLKRNVPSPIGRWRRVGQLRARHMLRRLGSRADIGNLRRVTPVSIDAGWDRGQPVDRYHIEKFLAELADDV